jgi:outer membrane protein assembly factor BamB
VATPGLLVVPTARGATVVAVKPGAAGRITAGSPFEQWRTPKGSPDVPSPLIHGGQVYLCRENGVLIGLDAATGKELYQERVHASRYRASPVAADGKVYLTARDGTFSVLKAGPKYELLATNLLPDEFTASPAVANGRIYLRGFRALYAVQDGGKQDGRTPPALAERPPRQREVVSVWRGCSRAAPLAGSWPASRRMSSITSAAWRSSTSARPVTSSNIRWG